MGSYDIFDKGASSRLNELSNWFTILHIEFSFVNTFHLLKLVRQIMFGTRLKQARKAAGLSLRNLAEIVDVSHAAIKKYEDGHMMPSSDVLIKLSRALKVRSEYFFRPEPLITLDGIEYRKRSCLSKKRLSAITHEIIDQIERRIELESLFPTPPIKAFSKADKISASAPITCLDQIEQVAECIRKELYLGLDPIPDLIDVLENNGIHVFMIEADGKNKFDGLAAKVKGMPIVVVGCRWPGDRQRFTLAHELGHLILEGQLAHNLNEEKACNRFAGAFLFPETSVRQKLGESRTAIELKELAILKEEFGLSMGAILYRARDLKIISPSYHRTLIIKLRRKSHNHKEPGHDCPTEKAHVFEQLLFRALAENYIGESKAAELMNVSLRHFHQIRLIEGNNVAVHQ